MQGLSYLDWGIILTYFVIILAIALYYSKKAGQNTNEFFLSGRNMPWWLAGTAMVATTFAADTPLAVTELIAKNGIAGNWLWWNMAIGSMLTVFFFAKLWRRSGILTDVEFVELRYSGKAASFLRGFRAIYLGLFMNAIVLAWVNKAMEKIFEVTIPQFDSFLLIIICVIIISIYASASGLLGSARVDAIQFLIAMAGCIVLAFIVIDLGSGIDGIKSTLAEKDLTWVLDFTPNINNFATDIIMGGTLSISLGAFLAYIGLQWWSSWYPGADPGGGGYIAQRMMSAKDEKNSQFATLWFTIAHYCVRPWPWIIVAIGALVLLPRFTPAELSNININEYRKAYEVYKSGDTKNVSPELALQIEKFNDNEFFEKYENTIDPGRMYPKLMVKYLPSGLLGLMIAVFLSAYMSTISSQLNWGTSYLINDFYRRFIKKDADEKHYVLISRIGIFVLLIFSLFVTKYVLHTISGAWEFIINASAGIGLVLILRWFWWRINAWSEISAMIAPLIIYPVCRYGFDMQPPITLYPTVIGTTIVWLLVTFLTSPTKTETLNNFYQKIHPGGFGWKKIAENNKSVIADKGYSKLFINWFFGIILVYSALFSSGKFIFKEYSDAIIALVLMIISICVLYWNISKENSIKK